MSNSQKVFSLEVQRPVYIDPRFMNTVREIVPLIFRPDVGEDYIIVNPPLVDRPRQRGASEPQAKVYDTNNIGLVLATRLAVEASDDRMGSKFFRAKEALEKGVRVQPRKGVTREYDTPPLLDIFDEIERDAKLDPDLPLEVEFSGLVWCEDPLSYGGDLIVGLLPSMRDPNFDVLRKQHLAAEDALRHVSKPVAGTARPTVVCAPFMRISASTAEQRATFLDQIEIPTLFPLAALLGKVSIDTSL